ncbi:hypothetical protein [Pseudoduganella sp. R-34]
MTQTNIVKYIADEEPLGDRARGSDASERLRMGIAATVLGRARDTVTS